MQENSSPMENQ